MLAKSFRHQSKIIRSGSVAQMWQFAGNVRIETTGLSFQVDAIGEVQIVNGDPALTPS